MDTSEGNNDPPSEGDEPGDDVDSRNDSRTPPPDDEAGMSERKRSKMPIRRTPSPEKTVSDPAEGDAVPPSVDDQYEPRNDPETPCPNDEADNLDSGSPVSGQFSELNLARQRSLENAAVTEKLTRENTKSNKMTNKHIRDKRGMFRKRVVVPLRSFVDRMTPGPSSRRAVGFQPEVKFRISSGGDPPNDLPTSPVHTERIGKEGQILTKAEREEIMAEKRREAYAHDFEQRVTKSRRERAAGGNMTTAVSRGDEKDFMRLVRGRSQGSPGSPPPERESSPATSQARRASDASSIGHVNISPLSQSEQASETGSVDVVQFPQSGMASSRGPVSLSPSPQSGRASSTGQGTSAFQPNDENLPPSAQAGPAAGSSSKNEETDKSGMFLTYVLVIWASRLFAVCQAMLFESVSMASKAITALKDCLRVDFNVLTKRLRSGICSLIALPIEFC